MGDQSNTRFDNLPLPAKRRIDAICARFEDAWRTGRPLLETYCEAVPPSERPVLLTELLHIEVERRRGQGEVPVARDYLARFRGLENVVREVLPEPHDSQPSRPDNSQLTIHAAAQGEVRPAPAPAAGGPVEVPGYELSGELGRGGMGIVYRARHLALNRQVALKFILAGGNAPLRHKERFRKEAEVIARLRHPNIVQIYDIGEANGQSYLALEYAEGGSLRERLAGTPMEPRAAVRLMEPLARAVQHAHRQGVIHRDLKPANILLAIGGDSVSYGNRAVGSVVPLTPEQIAAAQGIPAAQLPIAACTPKLTDFGLARLLDAETPRQEQGLAAGTPSYMAPEQASGGAIGPPADVWALGANLYELLTGRPPFRAPTTMETLRLVVTADPIPPSQLQPGVPRDLDTICLKCLQKDPARRYPGARELAQDLRSFLAGETILARPAGRWERALKWLRRHPALAALGGLVLLLALTGLVTIAWVLIHLLTGPGRGP
jgi:serine/threonine protein kinase